MVSVLIMTIMTMMITMIMMIMASVLSYGAASKDHQKTSQVWSVSQPLHSNVCSSSNIEAVHKLQNFASIWFSDDRR